MKGYSLPFMKIQRHLLVLTCCAPLGICGFLQLRDGDRVIHDPAKPLKVEARDPLNHSFSDQGQIAQAIVDDPVVETVETLAQVNEGVSTRRYVGWVSDRFERRSAGGTADF